MHELSLAESLVDLVQEIGGTDACQEALDAGGVQCGPTDGNGGNGPGG